MNCTLLRIVCVDRQARTQRGGSARVKYDVCVNCKQGKEIMKEIEKAKPLEVDVEVKTEVEKKLCVSCGSEFKRDGEQVGSWKLKKYCSTACRKKEENRRAMEKHHKKQATKKMGAGTFGGYETVDETKIWHPVFDQKHIETLLRGADDGKAAGGGVNVDDTDWNTSTPRGFDVLMDALRVINGDRQDAYGNPEDSFQLIADLWSSYVRGLMTHCDDVETDFWLGKKDVALMMSLLNVAFKSGSDTGRKWKP